MNRDALTARFDLLEICLLRKPAQAVQRRPQVKRLLMALVIAMMPIFIAGFADAGVQPKQNEPRHHMNDMAMMQSCPMNLEGTDLSVADTPTGVVVTITTK